MAANKSRPLEFIKQTSKAILFEEFNSSADDLYTIIKNENVREKSEFFKIIEDKLEVRSFEEFSEKFMPSVWEWIEASDNPNKPVSFRYSMEKPDGIPNAHELRLDKNEFYSMVMKLYEQKGSSGECDLEFDYSMVAELLSPNKVLERAKQLRRDLEYNYSKMLSLGEGSKQEKNKCIKQINAIRQEIVAQYKDSVTGVIKLTLADSQRKLALLSDNSSQKDEITVINDTRKKPCLLGFTDDGSLDIKLIDMQDNNTDLSVDNDKNAKLIKLISDDYDNYSNQGGDFVKNIITSTYCNTQIGAIEDREKLVEKCNIYTALYKDSQEQFIRAISSAIEKVLNVKAFFEQATISNKKKLPSSLIITNCSAEKLLYDEKVKSDFEFFLTESSRELDYGRIWFAIIPAIGDSDFIDNIDEEVSLDAPLMNDDFSNVENVKTTDGQILTSLSVLKVMLNILKTARITTFFNFRANEKTGFAKFNEDVLESYRNKLTSINGNHYAVFSYPNFTVLPKKETYIKIGKTEYDSVVKSEYIDIPGIYIDASYVAAGLVVASQNPDYLADKYSSTKINPGYPCVRFDIERENNRFIMLTKMNREGKVAWPSDVEADISKDKFGFCFCGNTKYYNNQLVNNTYVFTARNMCREDDGQYEPIYKRLTMDFVEQYLRAKSPSANGNHIRTSDVTAFLKEDAGEWSRSASEDYENNILRSNGDVTENIVLDNESRKLKITFQGTESEMDIEIIKE